MQSDFRISSLIPAGFAIESVDCAESGIVVVARGEAQAAICPLCGSLSRRIHSRYVRRVADLPSSGREVRLRLVARRFVCDTPHCRRRVFAERFGDGVLPERSRRTARLECIVHHLGLALGGRPAASLAKRLMLPVSNDTLLRVVRRRCRIQLPSPPHLVEASFASMVRAAIWFAQTASCVKIELFTADYPRFSF